MGFWQRLSRLEDRVEPVRVGLIGNYTKERELLERAYKQNQEIKVIFSLGFEEMGRVIKADVEVVEIFAGAENQADIAMRYLEQGVNVSLGMPVSVELSSIEEVKRLAEIQGKLVRVRNHCLYYEPYQRAREILAKEKIGYPTMLKLVVKRNSAGMENFDMGRWILEKESDYLSLAEYFYGRIEKVFMMTGSGGDVPGSILLGLKFKTRHRFGYLLADFSPGLQIRNFSEPVFRQVWASGTAGVLMINRGEGQLWRTPVLLLRAKNYAHSYEDLKDSWEEIYSAMVNDVINVLRRGREMVSGISLAERGVRIALSAVKSFKDGKEVLIDTEE